MALKSSNSQMTKLNTLEKMKDSNKKEEQMMLESKYANLPSKPGGAQQLQRMQDHADAYKKKINYEKRRIADLDKQLADMRSQIMDQRRKFGGVQAARENTGQIRKQIKILDNRLDKALQKYNATLAHNRKLRENIDNLRRERLVFDQIYKKLEKELVEKKKEMAHIIEVSNKAYEARDAAVNEMARLKAQADKEQASFEVEWKELGRLIEHDRKMRDFMKHKSKDGELPEEETKLRKKLIKGKWSFRDKNNTADSEKVQSYGQAFAKIQEATGISDIDELVTTFINAEDENYRLYKYVDELNQEITRLEEQIDDIRLEIEKYKDEGEASDANKKRMTDDLQDRLAKTESKTEVFQQKYMAAMKIAENLKEGIWMTYNTIGANKLASAEGLDEEGVTEANMMTFLGVIEQRTNEVLQMYAYHQTQSGGEIPLPAPAPQTPVPSTVISIEPPSTTDKLASDSDEEEEEEEDRPLTRNELQLKTLKTLSKRESGDKKKKQPKTDAPKEGK